MRERQGVIGSTHGILTLLVWAVAIPASHAVIFSIAEDDFDCLPAVHAVATNAGVAAFREEIDAVRDELIPLKERDFEALFGPSVQMPRHVYAMPVGQHRGYSISGIRRMDPETNLNHTEFYTIGQAGIQVHYSIDGVSPAAILFYLKADDAFPRLTNENLSERLAWDKRKFDEFKRSLRQRRAKVFVWEVDAEREQQLYAGVYTLDIAVKLDEWISDGERSGYRLCIVNSPSGRPAKWRWYREDNTLAREAQLRNSEDVLPREFRWYHADGHSIMRYEMAGNPKRINSWWWCRPGSTQRFRTESSMTRGWRPDKWSWSDGAFYRTERDDNGDGLPDWFSESTDDYAEHPLQFSDSWAIHPDLIPAAYRINDQPNRCIPVRRIAAEPTETGP